MPLENVVETDLLVIGGGMAGCFAAIKAKEQGLDVTLVDKAYAGKSGQTPWARGYSVFHPEWGHNLDDWIAQVNRAGEYLNNREWTKIAFEDSYATYEDLISWGVEFEKERGTGPYPREAIECLHFLHRRIHGQIPRQQAEKRGVKILDRIMVTDLLKQDGKIVGAIGIPTDSYDLYIFKAKATVISAGAGGFKPAGWPIGQLTSDGDTMAYRAGAEITGKEFGDPHDTSAEYPSVYGHGGRPAGSTADTTGWRRRIFNAEGNEVPNRWMYFLELHFEAHAGRAPVYVETPYGKSARIGGAASGMSTHKTEGIWPVNTKCATSLPGLYAAGDSLGTYQLGALYCAAGCALSGSAVTGVRAGLGAAEYALPVKKPTVGEEELTRLKKIVYAPMERKGGFSPRWVTQVLQNTMVPYFIMYIKKEERMQAALTIVEFLRDHLVPKLTAKDAHELRLAHETKNMVLNAEMRLRASIFRTESRGTHYREDYPRRDDPAWLAWVLLKEEQGKMKVLKEPKVNEGPYAESKPNFVIKGR